MCSQAYVSLVYDIEQIILLSEFCTMRTCSASRHHLFCLDKVEPGGCLIVQDHTATL